MFTGLDDIDWSSLEHAYGPAGDVPEWIRGLVDLDPEVREESLDAFYGAVHHQGDLYDSTVAALPFLIEVLTTPDVPDRARVAELLTSIAGISEMSEEGRLALSGTGRPDADGDEQEFIRHLRRARQLIADAGPALFELAAHPDAALRTAVAPLLATLAGDVPGITVLLTSRLAAETDPDARRALLAAIGTTAIATGETALAGQLLDHTASAPASTRVAALVTAARLDPARAPVDGAAELLEQAYAEGGTPVESAGYETNTLVGSLRVIKEKQNTGRRTPHCDRIVEELTDVLGPRVDERIGILLPLLAAPHADLAGDALFAANKLVDRWRGDYREIIARTADLLSRGGAAVVDLPDRFGTDWAPVAERAEGFLAGWAPLSAPATEVMATRLAALDALPLRDGLPAWAIPFRSGPLGLRSCLTMLAGRGDERAFPMLLTALSWDRRPANLPQYLSRYPQHAERIVAAITGSADFAALLPAFGPAAAPLVPGLLEAPLKSWTATSLGRMGAAAAEAIPLLRRAAAGDDPWLAVAAAGALWRIDRWTGALPILIAHAEGQAGAAALTELAAMREAAEPAAAFIATFLDTPDKHWWKPAQAALALWSITGDEERTVPVLTAAWHANPSLRLTIAESGIASLAPLFRAELAAKLRHNASPDGMTSHGVAQDERLLTACRTGTGQEA